MRALLAVLTASVAVAAAPASRPADPPAFDHTHALWTAVLKERVRPDGFDYAGLRADRSGFDAYLRTLRAVTPEEYAGWTREQQLAFWIDVYNAYTVALVAGEYPVDSIESLGGLFGKVWDREFIPLRRFHPDGDDDELSLDDVAEKILRQRFQDARVHVALDRASRSGPPLRAEAYVADRLDEQLDAQVRAWLADPARNRYDRTATTVHASRVLDWFRRDFSRDAGSVQAWIARYAPEPHARWIREARDLKIEYLEYSWKLDDAQRR